MQLMLRITALYLTAWTAPKHMLRSKLDKVSRRQVQ